MYCVTSVNCVTSVSDTLTGLPSAREAVKRRAATSWVLARYIIFLLCCPQLNVWLFNLCNELNIRGGGSRNDKTHRFVCMSLTEDRLSSFNSVRL